MPLVSEKTRDFLIYDQLPLTDLTSHVFSSSSTLTAQSVLHILLCYKKKALYVVIVLFRLHTNVTLISNISQLRFTFSCRTSFSYCCSLLLSTFITLNCFDPFTGEQPGKYGGVKEALGNGYKGENEGRFIIDAQRSSQNIIKLFKIPPREEAGCVFFTANQI